MFVICWERAFRKILVKNKLFLQNRYCFSDTTGVVSEKRIFKLICNNRPQPLVNLLLSFALCYCFLSKFVVKIFESKNFAIVPINSRRVSKTLLCAKKKFFCYNSFVKDLSKKFVWNGDSSRLSQTLNCVLLNAVWW